LNISFKGFKTIFLSQLALSFFFVSCLLTQQIPTSNKNHEEHQLVGKYGQVQEGVFSKILRKEISSTSSETEIVFKTLAI